ncbi:HAD family phosphatase [Georgenia sp. TF02-10]|uniref:HAD family hydrolase n=1 Tax=Georgenia sp. TF02-10 TaxID=2917725 RepID=UPI001FA7AA24|nr:HAD family phosphatase [Georgenia sp. TF02-10]UNX53213.1 HAD family phosphatase [Georgenia sp. TF02-10]
MPASPYPTVVLDLGQVVIGWDPYLALADRMSRSEWEAFSAAIDFPAVNRDMDAGLTHAAAQARVARDHPAHADTFTRYCTNFAASLSGPVPGTAAVVEELHAAGVRLLGLTNWSAETFHHAEPVAPAIGLLDGVVVSGQEGVIKPDPAIFRVLLERYGLDPASTVFVDDSPANVATAAALGLHARVFTTAATLRADLRALGLPLAPAA